MTTETKQALEQKGIKLVPLYQLVWMVAIMLISIGVSYGIGITRVAQVERETSELKKWKNEHIHEVNEIRISLEQRLSSMEAKLDWLVKNAK